MPGGEAGYGLPSAGGELGTGFGAAFGAGADGVGADGDGADGFGVGEPDDGGGAVGEEAEGAFFGALGAGALDPSVPEVGGAGLGVGFFAGAAAEDPVADSGVPAARVAVDTEVGVGVTAGTGGTGEPVSIATESLR